MILLSHKDLDRINEQMFESSLDSLILIKIEKNDYKIIKVNKTFLKDTGFKKNQVVGKKVNEVLPPKVYERLLEKYKKVIKTKKPIFYESVTDFPKGKIYFETTIIPILDSKGKCTHIIGRGHEITKRKKAEIKLIESEKRYRSLVEKMSDGLGVQDKFGNVTFVNQSLCDMSGYTKEEILGRNISEFLDESNLGILRQQVNQRRKGRMESYELTFITKSGKKLLMLMSPSPIFDENGNYDGSFAVMTDITKIKKAEQKNEELLKELYKIKQREKFNLNERLVIYGFINNPIATDDRLAKELKIKRSTLTSIKNRLKNEYYNTIAIPNFGFLGCELITIIEGDLTDNFDFFKVPDFVYVLKTHKKFFAVLISRNFSDSKKQIDKISIKTGSKFKVTYFPFSESKLMKFFDFSESIRSLFRIKIKLPKNKYKKQARKKLTRNEKIILHNMVKYPNYSDIFISEKTNISRPTVSRIRKKLVNGNIVWIKNIPSLKKLYIDLICHIYSQRSDETPNFDNFFQLRNRSEQVRLTIFYQYTEYKKFQDETTTKSKDIRIVSYPIPNLTINKINFENITKKILEIE